MKRKLLWVAVMFALGEVTYIFTDRVIQIGIILIMLICCGKIKDKIGIKQCFLLFSVFILGLVRVLLWEQNCILENYLYGTNGNIEKLEEEDYSLSWHNKNTVSQVIISGEGMVVDVLKDATGNDYIVELDYIKGDFGEIYEKNRVIIYSSSKELILGKRYTVTGELSLFEGGTNPGAFDMYMYYKGKNIRFSLKGADLVEVKEEKISLFYKYKTWLVDLRDSLSKRLDKIVADKYAGIYKSILLGNKQDVSKEIKSLYRINGIGHLLAISGLHVSLIGGLIYKIFRRLGFNFIISGGTSIFIIISYGLMAGGSDSTIRAVIMILLSIIGEILGRNYDMLTGMSLALIIILLINPYKIYDGGVKLSFIAVLGVAVGKYICNIYLKQTKLKKLKKKKPLIYKAITSFIMSSSITAMTFPVVVALYYEASVYSIIINLIVIPLFTPVVGLGIAALVISCFDMGLAGIVIVLGEKILDFYETLCIVFMELPLGNINFGEINIIQIILYYCVIVVFLIVIRSELQIKLREKLYRKTGKWLNKKALCFFVYGMYLLASTGVMVFLYAWNIESKGECICFLDVGQGDGILIRSKYGVNMVIDGGSVSNEAVGEYVIVPALKAMKMARVDYWFITHTDSDHISGLIYILEQGRLSGIEIKNIIVSKYICQDEELKELEQLAKSNLVDITYMEAGSVIAGADFGMKIIYPDMPNEELDKNKASMVLEYTSDNIKAIFTGDVDTEGCEYIYKYLKMTEGDLWDILKIPHHGSRYSISPMLYSLVNEGYSIISCGYNNIYGHPHEDTIKTLENVGCEILRTDIMGAIYVYGK